MMDNYHHIFEVSTFEKAKLTVNVSVNLHGSVYVCV